MSQSTSTKADHSNFDEDESYHALLRMQRMFVKQIQREQALERERQCSTARSLGSIATVDEHVRETQPYQLHIKNPPKTSEFPIEKL